MRNSMCLVDEVIYTHGTAFIKIVDSAAIVLHEYNYTTYIDPRHSKALPLILPALIAGMPSIGQD